MEFERIHFYVEDAPVWCRWFCQRMGFTERARSRCDQTQTLWVSNGAVHFLLSSPLQPESPVAQYLKRHPPGVADVAFWVQNLEAAIARVEQAGGKVLHPIQPLDFPPGAGQQAQIAGWGSLTHTLIERPEPVDISLPSVATSSNQVAAIDHAVLNVAKGDLSRSVAWYERVLGFQRQQTFTIQTARSGLASQVLAHPQGSVQLPINEPTSANSQIQEFLNANLGSGIQHIALRSRHIVQTVAQLQQKGVNFLTVPSAYYHQLQQRHPQCHPQLVGSVGSAISTQEWQAIQQQRLLLDWRDETPNALLLQTFTQPIFPQPTFFFEIIERRHHAKGFGEGNFRALFEAIEREQMTRGSLV